MVTASRMAFQDGPSKPARSEIACMGGNLARIQTPRLLPTPLVLIWLADTPALVHALQYSNVTCGVSSDISYKIEMHLQFSGECDE